MSADPESAGPTSAAELAGDVALSERASIGESLRSLVTGSRGYLVVNLINFGDGIAYFGVLTLLTLYLQRDVGMGEHGTGMTVSMFTGLVTLAMLFGGFVSDRLGVRRALTWSLVALLAGRAMLLIPGVTGPGTVSIGISLLGLAWVGLGSGVLQPALYAGVKEYTDTRSASMGYALLYSIMNLGIVAESFASPYMRKAWAELQGVPDAASDPTAGIIGVILFCVIVTAAMLVLHLSLFTKRVESRDRRAADSKNGCASAPAADAAASAAPSGAPTRSMYDRFRAHPLADPRFLFFIFALIPVRTLFAHQWLTLPDYVTRCFDVGVGKHFEWVSGLNPLVIVVFVPLITALTHRVHVLTMMIVGSLITALSTFLLVGGPDLTLLISYVILFSLGEAAWSSRFLEYVADLAPAGRVGAYMGVAMVPWFIAKFTTGFYSGAMIAEFIPKDGPQSSETLWFIYGLIALLSPVALIAARRWLAQGVRAAT